MMWRHPLLASSAAGLSTVAPALEVLSTNKAHGGVWTRFRHTSEATGTPMTFSVFTPPQASASRPVPSLIYLSGLTCTDENFVQKAGASRAAAAAGLALVAPDTSPRHPDGGEGPAGEHDAYDFGSGAGFYVDATAEPWASKGYKMESYVMEELRGLLRDPATLPELDGARCSVMGHSMGGHGALKLAFSAAVGTCNEDRFVSASAFSPICHPTNCPWGQKAFRGYFAGGVEDGEAHDATLLMHRHGADTPALQSLPVLVDQGGDDAFLAPSDSNGPEGQLQPEALRQAFVAAGRTDSDSAIRIQEGYDHSYFFIATFVDDHIAFHARHLLAA